LLINGTADTTVPYTGSRYSRFLKTPLTAAPVAARTLAHRDGCTSSRVTNPSRLYSVRTYAGCAPGSSVQLLAAKGVGHRWPTLEKDHIDGGQLAWQYLSSHTLR
jgi:poly(3-hydroxybutyrate) depolymerase